MVNQKPTYKVISVSSGVMEAMVTLSLLTGLCLNKILVKNIFKLYYVKIYTLKHIESGTCVHHRWEKNHFCFDRACTARGGKLLLNLEAFKHKIQLMIHPSARF